MATLSGNKIKNTYQALVKFSDNGNITTSAKQLTDGFGNNSPMWVSTTQVGIGVTPEAGLNLHVYGDAKIGSNLTVIGNLVVEGSTTTVGTDTLTVKDPLIVLANNNTSTDAVDIGFYGKYTPSGTTLYSGLFREALTGKYRLFKGLQIEPTTTVSISGTGYDKADLVIGNIETNGVVEDSSLFTFSKDVIINKAGTTKLTIDNVTQNKSIELECTSLNNVLNAEGDMIFSSGSPIFKYTSSSFEVLNVDSTFGGDITVSTGTEGGAIFLGSSASVFSEQGITFKDTDTTIQNAFAGGDIVFKTKTGAGSQNTHLTLFADGTSAFTGQVTIPLTPSANTDAASKGYVDTQVGANNELSEVLENGNTTGGTDIAITAGDKITNFTSTGIDDNATSNVLELDSVGNAIFEKSSGAFLMLKDSSTVRASINVTNNDDLIFSTTSSYTTALTIDSDQDATFAGNVSLADDKKIRLGTGNDLQIYHNGSQDRIESSSAFLVLEASNVILRNNGGSEDYAKFLGNAAVELYYNNSKKFETTSTGVSVTGNGTFAGSVDINGNLDVTSTASDAVFLRSSQATTTNVYITNTNATANNTANLFFAPANNVAGSYIKSTAIEDFSTSANRTSDLRFAVRKDGTFNEALIIDSDGNVGIAGTPATTLDIKGTGNTAINSKGNLLVSSGGTAAQAAEAGGQISFGSWLNGDLSAPYAVATIKGITESSTTNNNRGALVFGTMDSNTTIQERLRIDSDGSLIVGTATVAAANAAADNIVIKGTGAAVGLTISQDTNSGTGTIFFGDAASSSAAVLDIIIIQEIWLFQQKMI